MNKKYFLPLIILFSIALGFFIGRTVYKSKNIFYAQNSEFKKLKSLLDIVEENYSDKINVFEFLKKELIIKLSAIDPYANFYSEDEYSDYKNKIYGEFYGLGIRYASIDDTIRVLSVMDNSPAEKKGLKKLDAIISLNNKSIVNISTDSLSKLFKNKNKIYSISAIEFLSGKTKKINLSKEKIQINPIYYKYFDDNIAYIKINSFQRNTFEFFEKAENDLIQNHKINKVILDLRDNGGGLLQASIDVVNEFFKKGIIIAYTETNSKEENTYTSDGKGKFQNVELIVLVNNSTASASELVTLSLQDNDRALIIGSRTYGKGVFQQDMQIIDNNIAHVTTGKYYGPSKRNINSINPKNVNKIYKTSKNRIVYGGNGISPDILCDSVYYNSIIEDIDLLFLPMVYYFKSTLLTLTNLNELEIKMKTINPIDSNAYLNYIAQNSNYYEKIKFLSVVKFLFLESEYENILMQNDYCFQQALETIKTEKIRTKIAQSDTLKPIISKENE